MFNQGSLLRVLNLVQ